MRTTFKISNAAFDEIAAKVDITAWWHNGKLCHSTLEIDDIILIRETPRGQILSTPVMAEEDAVGPEYRYED